MAAECIDADIASEPQDEEEQMSEDQA